MIWGLCWCSALRYWGCLRLICHFCRRRLYIEICTWVESHSSLRSWRLLLLGHLLRMAGRVDICISTVIGARGRVSRYRMISLLASQIAGETRLWSFLDMMRGALSCRQGVFIGTWLSILMAWKMVRVERCRRLSRLDLTCSFGLRCLRVFHRVMATVRWGCVLMSMASELCLGFPGGLASLWFGCGLLCRLRCDLCTQVGLIKVVYVLLLNLLLESLVLRQVPLIQILDHLLLLGDRVAIFMLSWSLLTTVLCMMRLRLDLTVVAILRRLVEQVLDLLMILLPQETSFWTLAGAAILGRGLLGILMLFVWLTSPVHHCLAWLCGQVVRYVFDSRSLPQLATTWHLLPWPHRALSIPAICLSILLLLAQLFGVKVGRNSALIHTRWVLTGCARCGRMVSRPSLIPLHLKLLTFEWC